MKLAEMMAAAAAARQAGLDGALLRQLAIVADLEAAGGEAPMADVRDRLHHLAGGNWKRIVDDAQRYAMIAAKPDPQDGRRQILVLKDSGRVLLAEWRRRIDGAQPEETAITASPSTEASAQPAVPAEPDRPEEPPPVDAFEAFAGDASWSDGPAEDELTGDAALLAENEREQAEREEEAPVLTEPLAPPPREIVERPKPAAPQRPTAHRVPQMIGNRYRAVPYGGRPTSFAKLRPEEIVQVREPPGAPHRDPPGVKSR
jgi:hypothetical protein